MKRPNTSVTEALTPFTMALIANFSKVTSLIDFETYQQCHFVEQSFVYEKANSARGGGGGGV